MYVKELELKSFRNYESLSVSFDPGTNIFYGRNAQGKTNILEAVYLGCTTKSHRGSKDRDLIRMGDDESHIRLKIDRRENEYRIDIHLKNLGLYQEPCRLRNPKKSQTEYRFRHVYNHDCNSGTF